MSTKERLADRNVTTTELASILGITGRRVQQLTQDGVLTTVSRGKFVLSDAVQAYIGSISRGGLTKEEAEGVKNLERITPSKTTSAIEPAGLREKCYEAMNDDLNTPIVISHLFDAIRMINTVIDKKATISADDLEELKSVFHTFVFDILGLKAEAENNAAREEAFGKVVDMLLEQRMQAKANKDWATSDKIRDTLAALGFEVKDTKDGFTWKLNK